MTSDPQNDQPDTSFSTPSKPELLAPAGDMAALRAAIGNGADAVYLGAGFFNARRNAPNFGPAELVEAIDYAHLRSARVYLTLNTLVADDEAASALELAAEAYTAGVDAVILQDIGLAAVLHQMLPGLPLHASTQMTIYDRAGLMAAAQAGVRRVILPRELSLAEIRRLSEQAAALGLQTEVFIHGALCIAYSGQCLMSSLIGGRSGNRGECAQPCRLPWQRTGPGTQKSKTGASDRFPWLSPRDQSLLGAIPELMASGVASLKIEGRMRSSAYVGQVTAVYRTAIDRLTDQGSEDPEQQIVGQRRLLLAFNRGGGFTDRYASGRRQMDFLSGTHTGSHGIELGHVRSTDTYRGVLTIMTLPDWPVNRDPSRGDVLSIRRPDADSQQDEIASAPIGTISRQGRLLLIKGFHPDVLGKLREGDPVFQMNDRLAEQTAQKADIRRTQLQVTCQGDDALVRLCATVLPDQDLFAGLSAELSASAEPTNPLNPDRVLQQLAKTGGTPFQIADIILTGPVRLSIAALNDLRRRLLDVLSESIIHKTRRDLPAGFTPDWQAALSQLPMTASVSQSKASPAVTAYYLDLPDDLETIPCGADRYALPLMSLTPENAVAIRTAIRSSEPESQVMAWLPVATAGRSARLIEKLLAGVKSWGIDGLYTGNPGLAHLADPSLSKVADLGANIFNQATLTWFAAQGAAAASPSPELDSSRIETLLHKAGQLDLPLELPLYGRLRLMTSEYCPIGHNLPGCRLCVPEGDADAGNGLPDPDRSIRSLIKDRRQQTFPVVPHPRVCTSDIYSHFVLSAAPDVCQLINAAATGNTRQKPGVRLQFLEETPAERRQLTSLGRQLLLAADEKNREQAAADFQFAARRITERLGCTAGNGHYQRGV